MSEQASETFSSFSSYSSEDEDPALVMVSEKLIELVKPHIGLNDLSRPNYSDSKWKQKVWKEKVWRDIADELHKIVAPCKNRRNNLRDVDRKALKRNKTTSGQATKIIKKYKHEDHLKDFLQERDNISNVSCNISSSSKAEETIQGTQVNIEDIRINKEKHEPIRKRPKRTKNHQEKDGETETASSIIMKYELEKKEMEAKTENFVHPVDAFLSGIGATLKTLDPYHLNLAKSRIFNIVQDIELNQIHA